MIIYNPLEINHKEQLIADMKTRPPENQSAQPQNDPLQLFEGKKSMQPPALQLSEDTSAPVMQRYEDEELMMSVDPSMSSSSEMSSESMSSEPEGPNMSYSPSASLGADGNISLGGSRTSTTTVPGDDPYGDPLYSSSSAFCMERPIVLQRSKYSGVCRNFHSFIIEERNHLF